MNPESQISELYFLLFNENPDSATLESLLKISHDHSMDYLENTLRNSKFASVIARVASPSS